MECKEIRGHLSGYIDSLLDAETDARVRKHLDACASCAEELASIKALVRELNDLEPVQAPADFLDQLHLKMEQPSGLSKFFRALFVPFKIKIPLEFAGAAAAAVLVFIVFNIQQTDEKIQSQISSAKQERIAQKAVPAAPAPSIMMEAHEPRLAPVRPEEEKAAAGQAALIELALVLSQDHLRQRPTEPQASADSFRADKGKGQELAAEKKAPAKALRAAPELLGDEMAAAPAPPPTLGLATRDQSASPATALDEALKRIKGFIHLSAGRILSVEQDEERQGSASSLLAEIPADQFHTFSERLRELGDLVPPPQPNAEGATGTIQVRIHIRTR